MRAMISSAFTSYTSAFMHRMIGGASLTPQSKPWPIDANARRRRRAVSSHGFKVADSDMHVLEPPDLWQRYIDPAWRHVAPIGLTELRRDMRVKVKSHVMLRIGRVRPASSGVAWSAQQDHAYAGAESRGWDATSQREAME